MKNDPVTTIYAELARHKSQWAIARDPIASKHHLAAGGPLGDALMQTRATNLDEVLLKLAELEEWLTEGGTESQRLMARSLTLDITSLIPQSNPPATDTPRSEAPAARDAPQQASPVVIVDRRARPVNIDGIWYGSITKAAVALSIPYGTLRQRSYGASAIRRPA